MRVVTFYLIVGCFLTVVYCNWGYGHKKNKAHSRPWQQALFDETEIRAFKPLRFNNSRVDWKLWKSREIAQVNTTLVNLLQHQHLESHCVSSTTRFGRCEGNYSQVLLWKSSLVDPNPLAAPHLVAVRNALVNWNGQVIDAQRHFAHGGCADLSWASRWINITFSEVNITSFHEPIVNMNHPYEGNVFHEAIEMHSQFLSFLPIFLAYPQVQVIMSSRLHHEKYLPLLSLYGVNVSALRVFYLQDDHHVVYAPYVISSLLGECCKIHPNLAAVMTQRLRSWPSRAAAMGRLIVVYDRYLDTTRRLRYADDVLSLLTQTFAPQNYSVVRFIGNESLDETIALFSAARLVLGVHGAGLTNILFMQPRATVIEIRPENYDVRTIEWLGGVLSLRYHVFLCGKGRYYGIIPINPFQIVAYVQEVLRKEAGAEGGDALSGAAGGHGGVVR